MRVIALEDIRRPITKRLIVKKGSLGTLAFGDRPVGPNVEEVNYVTVAWDGKKNLCWEVRNTSLEAVETIAQLAREEEYRS